MTTVGTLINIHKALVIPVVLGLMWGYGNWSIEAYLYLALHGTYSLLWLMKHSYYPDARVAQRLPVWIGLLTVFLPLAGYYLTPNLLISRHVTLRPYVFAIVLFLYIIDIFFHYVSDAQKFFTLRDKLREIVHQDVSDLAAIEDRLSGYEACFFRPSSTRTYNYLQVCGRLPSTCKYVQPEELG